VPARLRVLDPAVGDGRLLECLLEELPQRLHARTEVVGFDRDAAALERAAARLQRFAGLACLRLEETDFIDRVGAAAPAPFDLVIANPPYVRTQVLGSARARRLARRFGLSGRIDLSYAFLLGIASLLSARGVAGIITSNRFLSTRAGAAVRSALRRRLALRRIVDLGDTRLFDAAVLPAVLIAAARGTAGTDTPAAFSSLYQTSAVATARAADVLAALAHADGSVVGLDDGRRLRVRHGRLACDAPPAPWRLSTQSADAWLETVAAHSWGTFARIGRVRVGIKTTADRVFIRDDWDSLPGGTPELLRPLLRRQAAHRFRSATGAAPRVLYPHVAGPGGRRPVDLAPYPRAARYLEQHRERLESRAYLRRAGRRWYEIWVPQDPDAWAAPKLVFPDIAAQPSFCLDLDGHVVSGECYWLRAENGAPEELLWLALAVGNSAFTADFYDRRFNNRLYAGRRRFMTQYVENFPLPDPQRPVSRELIALAQHLHAAPPGCDTRPLERTLEARVWEAFGLAAEAPAR